MGTNTNRVIDKRSRGTSLTLRFQKLIKQEIKTIMKIIIMIITTELPHWNGQ